MSRKLIEEEVGRARRMNEVGIQNPEQAEGWGSGRGVERMIGPLEGTERAGRQRKLSGAYRD